MCVEIADGAIGKENKELNGKRPVVNASRILAMSGLLVLMVVTSFVGARPLLQLKNVSNWTGQQMTDYGTGDGNSLAGFSRPLLLGPAAVMFFRRNLDRPTKAARLQATALGSGSL